MNPLRGFETARGHPFATDRHPLTGMSHPAQHRLNRHGAVHQPDAGVGCVAGGGDVGAGRRVTAVTDGAGHGRRGCDGGGLRPCGCRR